LVLGGAVVAEEEVSPVDVSLPTQTPHTLQLPDPGLYVVFHEFSLCVDQSSTCVLRQGSAKDLVPLHRDSLSSRPLRAAQGSKRGDHLAARFEEFFRFGPRPLPAGTK
jgi:hypothetical protein